MDPADAFDELCSMVQPTHDPTRCKLLRDIVRQALAGSPGPVLTVNVKPVALERYGARNSGTHIREFGSTLCGIHANPKDWTNGDDWVPIDCAQSATCPACMEAFARR